MFKNLWPLALLAVTLAAPATNTRAHEIVGNRFFPATLAIDDPGVNDELALPTISMSKTGDDPSFKQLDVSAEFAKRITEDFAISVAPTWSRLYAPGGLTMNGARGFQNLETLFKYRLFKNAEHEFVLSAGLEIEWGRTGAQGVGAELRRPAPEPQLGAAVRNYRPNWLLIPGRVKNNHYEREPRHRLA
jgi:hypothetical protein